ncbi:MAG: LacI family DNA-binding transcriptional regulator [Sphingobacteriales bacterium]|nr:LacI family DNA-binding transcriptional regulator [Sphingobacteriales bacterium]OJY90242.1 MAG: LacI family transcriptional regulator [Sphingobacteriales bacterium 44-15]
MSEKVPTIKEIARRLNISISTVSRALHDHPSIGLRTKMQVQKLAAEMNYEPNQTAIQFKQGKTFTIGLILPNLMEEYFSLAINGVEQVALENNYNVLIGQSHDNLEREQKILETMRRHRVDGIVVSISKQTNNIEHFEQLEKYKIPVVFFDRVPNAPNIHSVWCSLYYSTIDAVELLFRKGHKRVAYMQGPLSLNIKNERLEGYYEAHKRNKAPVSESLIVTTDLSKEGTERAFEKLLSLKEKPTAILAFNDTVALDTIQYAKKKKLKIDKDISVVSYANWPITSYLDFPPIASVEQFPYEQGVRATELLFKLLNTKSPEGSIPYENVVLKSELIVH